ncbi:MAG: molybdopterin-synthase adenylyltransferase MoeB [Flavobacteriales bacterium]|nr:molybdopterin-synthase adenylyltransferase MoeB [Flavobacteriales bacterium]
MATIIIPTPLRKFTDNKAKIETNGKTVYEALGELGSLHPDLSKHLFLECGKLQSFLKVYLGESDINSLEGETTAIDEDDIISIIPAIAGGRGDFSKAELERYSRHLIIPEFNIEGQRKLKQARVLVIGTGGLGAPLLQYLAAAGVGTIGIVDFDVVEDSNLQRQVLFTQKDIGRPKVEVAKERILSQNPHITVHTYNTLFTSQNAIEIAENYDLIADGTDNFPTRYLVNDVAVQLKIPNVYASIFRFEGQLTVFNYADKNETGPNYRDLFPAPPPPGLVPSCAEGGVIGVLPGILGSLQANEVIKVITGIGETLSGKLFLFDALNFETRILKIEKDKNNPLTGESPTLTELIDYEQFCGLNVQKDEKRPGVKGINVETLNEWLKGNEDVQLIDVREPFEYEIANLNGQLIPQNEVLEHVDEISKDHKVVIHCRSGKRSADVIELLQDKYQFQNLYNLEGGILDWADKIDDSLAKY